MGVVADVYHPVPVQAAVRMAHYGMYETFDVLRQAGSE